MSWTSCGNIHGVRKSSINRKKALLIYVQGRQIALFIFLLKINEDHASVLLVIIHSVIYFYFVDCYVLYRDSRYYIRVKFNTFKRGQLFMRTIKKKTKI